TARGGAAGAVSSSTGAGAAVVKTPTGKTAAAVKAPSGNVYAGADGNVYQHGTTGWSKWDNGSWQAAQPAANAAAARTPTPAASAAAARPTAAATNFQQLDQDRFARTQAAPAARAPVARAPAAAGRIRR